MRCGYASLPVAHTPHVAPVPHDTLPTAVLWSVTTQIMVSVIETKGPVAFNSMLCWISPKLVPSPPINQPELRGNGHTGDTCGRGLQLTQTCETCDGRISPSSTFLNVALFFVLNNRRSL